MSESFIEVRELAKGYTRREIGTACQYFIKLREDCLRLMNDNPGANTKAELLVHKVATLMILKLDVLLLRLPRGWEEEE